jgi:hypothetical protein
MRIRFTLFLDQCAVLGERIVAMTLIDRLD